jgi:hypothetical protein
MSIESESIDADAVSSYAPYALVSPLGDPDVSVVEPSHVAEDAVSRLVVHLLDNGKWNANHLFTGIQAALAPTVAQVTRSKKFHYSVVADGMTLGALAGSADVVVTGVGDCGSCTSCSVHDAIEMERRGIPAVLISTTNFMAESRLQADLLGMTGLRIVEIEHPIASRSREHMEQLGHDIAAACLDLLVAPSPG